MILGQAWTGKDAEDLQNAMRLSNAGFATVLGVATTTVARWKANPDARITPTSQRRLDRTLYEADRADQQRFTESRTAPVLVQANGSTIAFGRQRTVSTVSVTHDPVGDRWYELSFQAAAADDGLDGPWTFPAALRSFQTVTESDLMQRREFMMLMGAELTAPAHHWLLASPVGTVTSTAGARIQLGTVTEIDRITASLRRMDDQIGGGTLLKMVLAQVQHVISLLRSCRYDDTVGRRLTSSAAELLRLAGWSAFDDGQHAAAQRYWVAALRGAHAAGDNALAANVLGFMSCQAKDLLPSSNEAATLATTALAGYRGGSRRVSAILHLRAGEAYAAQHSVRECRRALDAAFTDLDRDHAESAPEWSYWCDVAQAHAQAGYCHLQLGDHPRAQHHLLEALRLQDDTNTREGALRYTLLATTHLQPASTDLDRALCYAHQAVDLLGQEVTSARCVEHLATIARDFAPHHRHSGVRHLIDQVRAVQSATRSRRGHSEPDAATG
ncbi:hypothetical protein AB0C34_17750 [Nocardia sp. NPDC049220]|uniref:hypothetical protein n=1 Tax=Nocardia sp. NPDC049220 TaxID=3155273 RepID=UPI00340F1556